MEAALSSTRRLLTFTLVIFLFVLRTSGYKSERQTHELYVKTACNATTYPRLCNEMLSSYASSIKSDPIRLCRTALSLTLKAAKKAYSSVCDISQSRKLSKAEAGILRDCKEEFRDTIDELKQSIDEMKILKGPDAKAHLENTKAWVSAALTDEDTCVDGFDDLPGARAPVKKAVKKEVDQLEKVTSNTLSLINSLRY